MNGRRVAPAVLAIDGGNSKTDVALVEADGTWLASARGPGSCPHEVGFERCLAILDELVAEAATTAGVLPTAGRALAHHTAAFLAGADLPAEEERLRAAIHARGWGRATRVANDTFAVLRAGTSRGSGVAVVCGAGINCVGLAPDGRTARFPSLGRLTGDWGGGSFLGEEVLWWAVRGEDGRGPRTGLQRAATDHFGMERVAEISEAIHLGRIPWDRLHELTPLLFTVAADGDAIAGDLVDRLAEEVVTMAVVALRRLDLLDAETDVVLGGGVLAARHARLLSGIERRLTVRAPKAAVRVTTVPPVVGAALAGLDALGAGPSAEQRLRETSPHV